jgi:nucleotide-binding universal stress UspA family protein
MKTAICLDPFDATNKAAKAVFAAVNLVKGKSGADLAVYLASPMENQLNLAFDIPEAERFTTWPLQKLEKFMRKLKKGAVPTGKIIRSKALSQRGAAKDLCAGLEKEKIELIALPTHARKGMARFVFGSFAETVMNTSRTSLLLVNPQAKIDSKLKVISFATDWSDEDMGAFRQVLSLAAQHKASVVVTHVWESPILPESDFAAAAAYIEQAKRWVDQRSKEFAEFAKANHPKVSCKFENVRRSDRVEAVICKRSKKAKSSLIVTVSKVGTVGAALMGSVSRGVVREAGCPVLVFRA